VTRRMRKRDFRSCSISDFFNDIDVQRTYGTAASDASSGRKASLQESPREGPESLSKAVIPIGLHRERAILFGPRTEAIPEAERKFGGSMHVSDQNTNVMCLIARGWFRYLPRIRRPSLVKFSI
jgi:hypothetical protein